MAMGVSVLSSMKAIKPLHWMALVAVAACVAPASAQERIYRCGNEYTNNATEAKARGCKIMEGGNITIIQGTVPAASSSSSSSRSSASSAPRTSSPEQRARDSDARRILEAELRKAEERLAQAEKAYANGEPEKEGIEGRNHQRYLDRVAALKAEVDRARGDVNGLRRELERVGAGAAPSESSGAASSSSPASPQSSAPAAQ